MRWRALVVGFVVGMGAACAVTDAELAGARCVPGTADDCGAATGLVCDPTLNRCVLKSEFDGGAPDGGGGGVDAGGGGVDGGDVDGGCRSPEVYCESAAACVNTESDFNNCGACGTSCANATECAAGICVCPSNAPDRCVSDAGSSVVACTDLKNDTSNCGKCGSVCDANKNQVCKSGSCGCAQGQADCGAGCIDLTSDDQNCGGCNSPCTLQGQHCVGGTCACQAPVPDFCAGACVDEQSDSANCGTCGNMCTAGKSCAARSCRLIGETCANPEVLQPPSALDTVLSGSLLSYSDDVNVDASSCGGLPSLPGPDRVFRIRVPAGKQLTVTVGPSQGLDVAVYAGFPADCGATTSCSMGAVNAGGVGQPETLVTPMQSMDVDVDVIVDTLASPAGAFSFVYRAN